MSARQLPPLPQGDGRLTMAQRAAVSKRVLELHDMFQVAEAASGAAAERGKAGVGGVESRGFNRPGSAGRGGRPGSAGSRPGSAGSTRRVTVRQVGATKNAPNSRSSPQITTHTVSVTQMPRTSSTVAAMKQPSTVAKARLLQAAEMEQQLLAQARALMAAQARAAAHAAEVEQETEVEEADGDTKQPEAVFGAAADGEPPVALHSDDADIAEDKSGDGDNEPNMLEDENIEPVRARSQSALERPKSALSPKGRPILPPLQQKKKSVRFADPHALVSVAGEEKQPEVIDPILGVGAPAGPPADQKVPETSEADLAAMAVASAASLDAMLASAGVVSVDDDEDQETKLDGVEETKQSEQGERERRVVPMPPPFTTDQRRANPQLKAQYVFRRYGEQPEDRIRVANGVIEVNPGVIARVEARLLEWWRVRVANRVPIVLSHRAAGIAHSFHCMCSESVGTVTHLTFGQWASIAEAGVCVAGNMGFADLEDAEGRPLAAYSHAHLDRGIVRVRHLCDYINLPQVEFAAKLFNHLLGERNREYLSFDEYLIVLCHICAVTPRKLLVLIYFAFDLSGKKPGTSPEGSIMELLSTLNPGGGRFPGNFMRAVTEFKVYGSLWCMDSATHVDVAPSEAKHGIEPDEFANIVNRYQTVMFPIFQLQVRLQMISLDQAWRTLATDDEVDAVPAPPTELQLAVRSCCEATRQGLRRAMFNNRDTHRVYAAPTDPVDAPVE